MALSTRDNMARLVQLTVDSFNTWDYATIKKTRAADFTHHTLPTTLGVPTRNNAEYDAYFETHMTPTFKKFKGTPTTIVHDPEARRSVMFSTVDIVTAAGAASFEIVMMFSFDEAAEKITRVDEFFDSLAMARMQGGAS